MVLEILTPEELRFLEAKEPRIQIESWSNAARTVHIRGFTRHGTFSFDHVTNADRSRKAEDWRIPEFPISLQASPKDVPVRRGELYVRLTLLLMGFPVGRLSTGYLTDSKTITWPPGVFEGFTEGPGLMRSLRGTDPAAGTEISETVPTNAGWRLRGLNAELVTDTTVIDREVILVINDGSKDVVGWDSGQAQAANESRYYKYAPTGDRWVGAVTGNVIVPIPDDLILFQGWVIKTVTKNLQSGDNWGAPDIWVEEWIEE